MSSNCVWLQKFCWCVKETTPFSFLRTFLRKHGSFPRIFIKKQTRWLNDKAIIELGYRKISWFISVSQINYLPKPNCSPLTNHDILLNLVHWLFKIIDAIWRISQSSSEYCWLWRIRGFEPIGNGEIFWLTSNVYCFSGTDWLKPPVNSNSEQPVTR